MRIIIATIKPWNIKNAKNFRAANRQHEVLLITNQDELTHENIIDFYPDYIFFSHWSWIIPREIHEKFKCIVFHMTDLPFGRGGSPLQNLISRGINKTRISAIKVDLGVDTGDIYLKKDLDLHGTAEEIFMRASDIIFREMIPEILKGIEPVKQGDRATEFKRLTEKDGQILDDFDLNKIYDYIRMLDAEGYPKAFIGFGDYKLLFSRAIMKHDGIISDVKIVRSEQ